MERSSNTQTVGPWLEQQGGQTEGLGPLLVLGRGWQLEAPGADRGSYPGPKQHTISPELW